MTPSLSAVQAPEPEQGAGLVPGGWTTSTMSHDAYLTVSAWMESDVLTPRIVWRELTGRWPEGDPDWWDVGHLIDELSGQNRTPLKAAA